MSWPVRTIAPAEYREFMRVCDIGFGDPGISDEEFDDCTVIGETDRNHVALEGDQFVGTTGAYSFELTVPGGARVPMAGVTDVSVLTTHRRRGVLTALMAFQLDAIAERGDPVAGLTASEGLIYRRFGYGIASRFQILEVDSTRSAFLREPDPGGRLRFLEGKDTASTLGPVWDAHRRATPGGLSLSPGWWELFERDRERWRRGASALFRVGHEDASGALDGYVAYRVKEEWGPNARRSAVYVDELIATSPEVEAALWRHCFDVDLTNTVKAWNVRLDDPIKLRVADRRSVSVSAERDHLWLRFLDLPACLEARAYAADGSLTVEVVDAFRPASGGTFRLDVDGGQASCERATGASADLVLDTADLASTYLGDVTFAALRDVRLVEERTDGAVARADALFRTAEVPWCVQGF